MMTLAAYMHENNLTQGAAAAVIGVSRSYLSEILSGAKRPGRAAIERIEAATGGAVPAAVWFRAPVADEGAA